MTVCWFAQFRHASPEQAWLTDVIAATPALREAIIFTPSTTRDPYLDDGPPPQLALQLYFDDIVGLESAVAAGGHMQRLDALAADGATQQAMLVAAAHIWGATLMQFGLFGAAQAQRGGPDVDSAAGFKDYIEYVIEAEALGYQSAFIVEHHFTGFGQVSATLNLLTWIGARTRTLRLGTAVIVLPWHNPVLLAEQAATVDLLSGGRLDFGIGKGYRHNEFVGFRVPMEEAEPRFEESIDIITKAWTSNERFSFHGRYWQFDDIIVEPPTIQKPHPPFWQGAGHPESIRRVARRGHNLLLDQFASLEETGRRFATYRDAMQANGFAFHPSQVGVARAFYVARNSAEKEAALDRRIAAQRRLHAISQRPDGNNTASIMAFSDTRAASEESALYGNPDEIARKIATLRDMGVEYILLNGRGTSRDNLRRFAKEVMPAFRTEPEMRAAG